MSAESLTELRKITGSIGYVAYRTRGDVASANAKCQEKQSNGRIGALKAARNLLGFMAT